MVLRKENFIEGEYYHIYNRGNSKQDIFLDDNDRDRFTKLLYLCNSTRSINFRENIIDKKIDAYNFDRGGQIVSIGAWVLMSNHFHIYLTPSQRTVLGADENLVTVFMKKLCTAYSMYFNKKYERTGSLFEGRFKSKHAEDDNHIKYNFSYIHLNPIKIIDPSWRDRGINNIGKALKFLDNYRWSSYLDFKGIKRSENKILNIKEFPNYFSNKKIFDEEIFDWLAFECRI